MTSWKKKIQNLIAKKVVRKKRLYEWFSKCKNFSLKPCFSEAFIDSPLYHLAEHILSSGILLKNDLNLTQPDRVSPALC